jgi:hypothetical protein
LYKGYTILRNQINQDVRIYLNALHLTTLKPQSQEKCKVWISHHGYLNIRSFASGVKFSTLIAKAPRESKESYPIFDLAAMVNDSVIFKKHFFYSFWELEKFTEELDTIDIITNVNN